METAKNNGSGFSQLVEVATALTELVDAPQAPISELRDGDVKVSSDTVVSDDEDGRQLKLTLKLRKREIFPQRLMDILSDQLLTDVISWLPHGRSFVIVRPDIFTSKVLPKYLPSVDSRTSTKYPSFTRKLNRWGFRQATKGPDTGAFHHSLFRRDNPELCLQMVCSKSRDRQMTQKRTLPPKKRGIAYRSPTNDSQIQEISPQELSGTSLAASCVSADDRSVISFGNSTTSSAISGQDIPGTLPSSILSERSEESGSIPFISNDSAFVSKSLRQRDSNEVVRAAKVMLYDAYMKVLKGDDR